MLRGRVSKKLNAIYHVAAGKAQQRVLDLDIVEMSYLVNQL